MASPVEDSSESGEHGEAMKTYHAEWAATTRAALDFLDITDDVERVVSDSGIRSGHVTVFAPHGPCAILINERESGLHDDIRSALTRLGGHTVVGSKSVVLPAIDGKLRLGTWQRVLLLETEAAQKRSVIVQIVGE